MFHLKTDNLEISHASNMNTGAFVSIQSMHFIFPFCSIEAGYIVIPISKTKWEIEASHFSDFSSFLPLRVESLYWKPAIWDDFKFGFTLRNFTRASNSSVLDRGLAEFIFPNTTFIDFEEKICFCCQLNLPSNTSLGRIEHFEQTKSYEDEGHNVKLPTLTVDEKRQEILLTTGKDEYTFISCGNTYKDPPNFLALFMPFTRIVWALIFMTIFGWPLVLSLIENDFKLKNVLKDFDALFIGWAMILEQSHLRATNYKGRGPLYCYCGCVLLALLILSNAYKGDNILTLTKSFELIRLTNIDQIINAGYKTDSRKACQNQVLRWAAWAILKSGLTDECASDFYNFANLSGHQYTDQQYKLWEPMDHIVTSKVWTDEQPVRVDFFGTCRDRKTLLGWRTELEDLEKELLEKNLTAKIYLGEEFIFSRRRGWILKRYGNIKILKRMWTAVESGIHNKLLSVSLKLPVRKVFQPRPVNIEGNILVQFVFQSFGLLLALLAFIVEFHKSIFLCLNPVRVIFGFLIGNLIGNKPRKRSCLG